MALFEKKEGVFFGGSLSLRHTLEGCVLSPAILGSLPLFHHEMSHFASPL
jgi:hypothetical protein